MPRYGDGSPYQFGNSFSNHSSLMTSTGSGRLHGPLVSRYSPHLSTISELPLNNLRRYSPVITSASRPKRVDTADIDVSTPRNLAHTDNHGRNRLRRDRPTIRIRSQALKDNPALRALNEKHEKTVGELLVEKFFIREKAGADAIKMVKALHQPSLERTGNEAIQKKVTRRLTRRRSSLEIPTDSEIIAREVIIAQAQAEALDSLVEQEQAQYKVEARRRTMTKRSMSRDSISLPSGSSDNESCGIEEAERLNSTQKTPKKTKKKKKIPIKTSLSQSEDFEEQITEAPHLKQTKSDSNLIIHDRSSRNSGEDKSRIRPQKFKIEACNSVGDFSTLWINASSAPTSPVPTEQFRESIRLPAPKSNKDTSLISVIDDDDQSESDDDMVVLALPKRFVRDSTRNSVHLTLKTATQEPIITKTRKIDNMGTLNKKNSTPEQLVNSRYSTKRFNNVNSIIDNVNENDDSKSLEELEIKTIGSLKNVEEFSSVIENPIIDVLKEAEDQSKNGTKISDETPDLPKKTMNKSNFEIKDISVKKSAQNLSDVPNPISQVSVPPKEKNNVPTPETISGDSLNNINELSKPPQDIMKLGKNSEPKLIVENSVDNISKFPKKPIKKLNSQSKDVSVKKPSNNFSDVPNPISEMPVLPTKVNNASVPDTIIQKSSNHIPELQRPTQDAATVGTKLEPEVISEKLPPQPAVLELKNVPEPNAPNPPISEVDFWGEMDPEIRPNTPRPKLSLKTDNLINLVAPVASTKETVDISEKEIVSMVVEDVLIQAETDLDKQDSKQEDQVPEVDVSNGVDGSLSMPLSDGTASAVIDTAEDNTGAKDQDMTESEKPEDGSGAQVLTSPVDEDRDELATPTPPVEERVSNSVFDPPLPTINIVAAPITPEANGVDSIPDEDPSTPTNEWPNASLTLSKWASKNDLSDATEVDKEATPTPPSGPDIGVSPQSSKKKKLVRKKKSVLKKTDSEENGSMDNSQRSTKRAPKKSPKPSPQESPKCSPRSSPRNSPKQRPVDLIRMFYTTPGPLLTATPRDLSKVRRGGKRRKRNVSTTTSSASDSTESARSTQSTTTESTEDNSSTCNEGSEETKDEKRLTSTRSNDSGFDGSPRLTNCDMACHKKCEKLTGNLCGLNQKLVAEALQALKGAPSQSSGSQRSEKSNRFQASGRITPPATNLPRFKKYAVTDFNFLKVLGKGSFGKVLLAELRDTDCLYAVKCLKKDVVLEDDDVECTLIERKVLTLATRHPYLCHLFCTFQTDSHLFFVMEYLNGGDLMFHIQRAGRFTEPRARFYAAEILSGLTFLHKKGIVYRDLKLDNVLLDFDGHIRIADFGMCKLQIYLDRTADTFCGTPDYMAPEIIKGLKYNQAVDWWSYGVLLYEMLTGQSPFSGCDEDELFWSICNERPFIPRYLSQESTDILVCLLEKDAGKRLPGHEITYHPFFQGLPWDRLERRQLEPPFKPALEHTLDTRYFDSTFTAERPRLSVVPEQILISMDQEVFRGFSYTNPNATD